MFFQRHKRKLLALPIALLLLGVAIRVANSYMKPFHQPGVTNGRLAECPVSPNCVSTQSNSKQHQIAPIPLTTTTSEALDRLEAVITAMPRTKIVTRNENYLHAEFHSFLLGFVDDVEFYVDEAAGVIHFRSASRVGYSDLGVNRERMEEIRSRYAAGGTTDKH